MFCGSDSGYIRVLLPQNIIEKTVQYAEFIFITA